MTPQPPNPRRTRIPLPVAVLASGVALTVALALAMHWVLESVETSLRESRTRDLKATLDIRVASLQTWAERQKDRGRAIAALPGFVRNARVLVGIAGTSSRLQDDLLASPAYAPIDEILRRLPADLASHGYGVVTPSGTILLIDEKKLVGSQIAPVAGEVFRRTVLGEFVLLRPYRFHAYVVGAPPTTERPILSLAGPIQDEQGNVVAVFGVRFYADRGFDDFFQPPPFGQAGDVLAFDRKGVLLSEPRDATEFRALGLLPEGSTGGAALNVVLRNPGRELPLGRTTEPSQDDWPPTRMVQAAIQGGSGTDSAGYRSFRGRTVLGAWRWLPDWDMGVAAEVEVRDVLQPVAPFRTTAHVLVGALALGTLLTTLAAGRRRPRDVFGAYTLEKLIAQGGMGEVYLARHATLRRPTALKIMKGDASDPAAVARFEREARLASQLTHPNTIQIFDFGETPDGRFYTAMEYLEGLHLGELVAIAGPLPVGRAVHLLSQVCASLEEAHAAGLVHRDIKPTNVMVCRRGGMADVVKVLDFGIARPLAAGTTEVTQAGRLPGTVLYIAPERIRAPQLTDPRSDLYSLGALAFFVLTGRELYDGPGPTELLYQTMTATPASPSRMRGSPLPPDLEALVLNCLDKDPEKRPPTAGAVMHRLREIGLVHPWRDEDARTWWEARPSSSVVEPGRAR